MNTVLEKLLNPLENVRAGRGRWGARCPAHNDRKNSLSIGTGADGRVLLRCFAGCSTRAILARLGLDFPDLFPNGDGATITVSEPVAHASGNQVTTVEYFEKFQRELKIHRERFQASLARPHRFSDPPAHPRVSDENDN